jgi:hypothetical protein
LETRSASDVELSSGKFIELCLFSFRMWHNSFQSPKVISHSNVIDAFYFAMQEWCFFLQTLTKILIIGKSLRFGENWWDFVHSYFQAMFGNSALHIFA